MITRILINILLKRLTGRFKYNYKNIEDKRIGDWLNRQFTDRGYREYFRKRDLQLLKTIGLGLPREQYLITIGQRLELLRMLEQVDRAHKADTMKEIKRKREIKISRSEKLKNRGARG